MNNKAHFKCSLKCAYKNDLLIYFMVLLIYVLKHID